MITVPILQGRARGGRWILGSGVRGLWIGTYERAQRIIFEKTISQGSVVFDIGANVGFYTLLASRLVGPEGKVFAFEPVQKNLFHLNAHLKMNRCTNATVIDAAVSDRSAFGLLAKRSNSTTWQLAADGGLKVRTVTLDNLIFEEKVLPPPDFIKIDIEAAEMRALLGAKRVLIEIRPTIFLSVHTSSMRKDCFSLLRSLGYCLQAIGRIKIEDCNELLAYAASTSKTSPI